MREERENTVKIMAASLKDSYLLLQMRTQFLAEHRLTGNKLGNMEREYNIALSLPEILFFLIFFFYLFIFCVPYQNARSVREENLVYLVSCVQHRSKCPALNKHLLCIHDGLNVP